MRRAIDHALKEVGESLIQLEGEVGPEEATRAFMIFAHRYALERLGELSAAQMSAEVRIAFNAMLNEREDNSGSQIQSKGAPGRHRHT